jgi:hypothetical protein
MLKSVHPTISLGISIYPQNISAQPLSPSLNSVLKKMMAFWNIQVFFHPNHLALLLKKHILPVGFESS